MTEPLDLLAIMAHPDDAELLCGGSLSKAAAQGDRVGVLDLTRGEAASVGSVEARREEAARAAEVMGLAVRRNAGLRDSGLINDDASRSVVVGLIRELRPRVIVAHWREGRHPDHRVAAQLAYDASFLSSAEELRCSWRCPPTRQGRALSALPRGRATVVLRGRYHGSHRHKDGGAGLLRVAVLRENRRGRGVRWGGPASRRANPHPVRQPRLADSLRLWRTVLDAGNGRDGVARG